MPSHRSEAEVLAGVQTILSRPDATKLINRKSSKGISLLHAACMEGHSSVIQCLIQAQLSLELDSLYGEWSPVMIAASRGHVECVRLLVAAGANPQPLLDLDPDQSVNNANNRKTPPKKRITKIQCLPNDPAIRKLMLSTVRAASLQYRNELHCVMMREPMLAEMPVVLIDIVSQYLTYG